MDSNSRIESVTLPVSPELGVSARLAIPEWWPSGHRVGLVLAHDLGSNQDHALLKAIQESALAQGFLSLRFNFPFAEEGRKRPDSMALLERTFRAATGFLTRDPQEAPSRLIFAGMGLGARVAANVVASGTKVDALICIAFPLHPSGKPSQQRADALFRLICPVLFVQGSRDPYCRVDRLELLLRRIGAPTQLVTVTDADHDLDVVKRTNRTSEEVRSEVLRTVTVFLTRHSGA